MIKTRHSMTNTTFCPQGLQMYSRSRTITITFSKQFSSLL